MDRLIDLGWEEEIRINVHCNELLSDRRVRRACEQGSTEKGICTFYFLVQFYP
jgi:hypothetical protein